MVGSEAAGATVGATNSRVSGARAASDTCGVLKDGAGSPGASTKLVASGRLSMSPRLSAAAGEGNGTRRADEGALLPLLPDGAEATLSVSVGAGEADSGGGGWD